MTRFAFLSRVSLAAFAVIIIIIIISNVDASILEDEGNCTEVSSWASLPGCEKYYHCSHCEDDCEAGTCSVAAKKWEKTIIREVSVDWNIEAVANSLADDAAIIRVPTLFRSANGSFPHGWKLWSPKELSDSFGDVLIDVETSKTSRHFSYFDIEHTENLHDMEDVHARTQVHRKMKLEDLLARVSVSAPPGSSEAEFSYSTSAMRTENMKPLRHHFNPFLLSVSSEMYEGAYPPEVNMWIGGPSRVRTSTHVDSLHNFFVQLHGRKTFSLHPPCAHNALKPFPHLHPQSRKSKVLLREEDAVSFPQQTMSVTVDAGDILYIPPYWWHGVVKSAEGPCISVNVFSASIEADVFRSAVAQPLPLDSEWMSSPSILVAAAHAWLTSVGKAAEWSAQDAAASIVHSRYDEMMPLNYDPTFHLNSESGECTFVHQKGEDHVFLPANTYQRFQQRAQHLASQHFHRIPFTGARRIVLLDYFEIVAFNLIGKEKAGHFFKDCF